jgi:hypothetical protein
MENKNNKDRLKNKLKRKKIWKYENNIHFLQACCVCRLAQIKSILYFLIMIECVYICLTIPVEQESNKGVRIKMKLLRPNPEIIFFVATKVFFIFQ